MWGTRCLARLVVGAVIAGAAVGCAPTELRPSELIDSTPGENMPGPASVWLTSDPPTPLMPVAVTMTSPRDPDILFTHTFVAGAPLRGVFSTSEGRYRMAALGGACAVDVLLGPSQVADVLLTVDGSSCSIQVTAMTRMDEVRNRPEPAVHLTNQNGGEQTPFEEPRPSPP